MKKMKINMKKFSIIAILFFVGITGFSQDKKWSLRECVEHALTNNITVKQGENTLLSNDEDILAAKGNFYPSFSANINQGMSLGNAELFQGQFVDRTAHTTSIGVNLNQTVFNGFRNTFVYKQAQINREANELDLNRIKDDISLNVANAYLNVLFNKENLEAAQSQYEFSQKQVEQVQELVDSGVQPQANVYDAEATLANDAQALTTAENNYDISLLTLSQLLQVPYQGFDVEIIDVVDPSAALLYNDVNPILESAFQNRYEIKVAEKNIESAEVGTELSKSGFYPSVTFGYGFGTNAFYSNLTQGEDAFFNQLNDQKAHSFNLNISIPIFSRFQNKTSVAKSRIQEENFKLSLEQAKLNLESNVQRAFTDAKAAFRSYEAARKSLESQQLAFDNSQERYNIGAMNAFDLEQARIRLINAQALLINAKYDFVFKTKVLDFYMGKPIMD
ncbi:TolC family protein [Winogradskyella sp. 3972H.M.0a.05]|uniref:TolC family protein n=1 Tax=Winogradskyella sp. 3972H.M.0a.05 TaxID=2950277 RepID=UPI003398F8F3